MSKSAYCNVRSEFGEHLREVGTGGVSGRATSSRVVIVRAAGQAQQMRHHVRHIVKHVLQRRSVLLAIERRQLPLSYVRQPNTPFNQSTNPGFLK